MSVVTEPSTRHRRVVRTMTANRPLILRGRVRRRLPRTAPHRRDRAAAARSTPETKPSDRSAPRGWNPNDVLDVSQECELA